jgi:hypothetical protein
MKLTSQKKCKMKWVICYLIKLAKGNLTRLKLPNFYLVKFVFDNNMVDLIVFLVLRFHKNSNDLSIKHDES